MTSSQSNSKFVRDRFGAVCLLVGTVIFAVATVAHPPSFDPKDPTLVLVEGMTRHWVLDHTSLLGATMLIGVGVAALYRHLARIESDPSENRGGFGTIGAPFAVTSFVLWILLFTFESSGWPYLANYVAQSGQLGIGTVAVNSTRAGASMVVAHTLWSALLGTGYVAAALFAVAVAFWGADLLRTRIVAQWYGSLALLGGLGALGVTPVAWFFPRLAPWTLLLGYAPLAAWFAASMWLLWRGNRSA